jgi:allantoin racemase
MKLVVIPPYKGMNWTPTEGQYMLRELVDNMQKKGQLQGVELTIDEGHPLDRNTESRTAAVYADVASGFLKRVALHGEGDRFDAIVSSAGNDVGFHAARVISKIPVVHSLHAALQFASLIGERFSVIQAVYTSVVASRHSAQDYGLGQKLVSGRFLSSSTTQIAAVVRKKRAGQTDTPEVRKFIDDVMAQCIMAIEDDRVDSLLLVYPGLQCFEDEIRQRLDESGYSEIPIICALPAAVEMARALVNMKLKQAARANPGEFLKAIPKFG